MVKSTKSKTAKAVKGEKSQNKAKATPKTETKNVIKPKTEIKSKEKVEKKSSNKTETKSKVKVEKKVEKKIESTPKQKRIVDKSTILTDFDSILSVIDAKVSIIRENKTTKSPINIKDMKDIQKQVRQLRGDVNRQIRKKRKLTSEQAASSGFMKPVNISSDMSKFAGWKSSDMHSRVDVTKFICGYIRDKNLQNPKDRRQILADDSLSKLLKLEKNAKEPLTYYSLQKHIQQHFVTV